MSNAPDAHPSRRLQYAAFILLCGIWGSTWMAIRVLVRDVPPLWGAALRFAIAAVLLVAWVAARRLPMPPTRRHWRANLLLGLTMMAAPYGLLFWAEQHITASMTALVFACLPLFVAFFTPLMSEHRVPSRALVSMFVGAAGLGILFYRDLSATTDTILGGLAVIGAVVSSAWSSLYAKRETAGQHPVVSTMVQLTIGAALLFLASGWMEAGRAARWTATASAALLFLAIAGSGAAFALYYWLLKRMQPYQLSVISLVVPIVAMAEGALLLGEPIPLSMLMAAVIVLGAVVSVLRAEAAEVVLSLRGQTE
jgi:drug/metabolite transporter (DMT)-like permease